MTKLSVFLPALQVLSLAVKGLAFTVPAPLVHHPAHSRRVLASSYHCHGTTGLLQLTYDDEVNETIDSMVRSSDLAYSFAKIRGIVKDYDVVEGTPKKGKGVQFDTPALVITQRGAQPRDQNRLFRYPITAAAIEKFLELNRNLLKQDPSGGNVMFDDTNNSKSPNDLPRMPIEEEMTKFRQDIDGEFLDYDDKDTTSAGLVYSLFKSRTKKRFTVAFRGTVGLGDILADSKFAFKTTPEPLKGEDIKLHRGFASYLFDDREELLDDGTTRTRCRFDRILAALKECYEELPDDERDDWDLCVTGHSLGGSLANIFAYSVAQTQRDVSYLDKVTAITIASPVVGDDGYNKAYQVLEREGRLRHLRISNEGDVMPSKPYPGYTQNGVNLHLFADKEMELDYRNTKNVLCQLNFSMLDKHKLSTYMERLGLEANQKNLSKKISDLYEVARDFTN